MTTEERQRCFVAVSDEQVEIAKHKVVGLVTDWEGELSEELDRLAFEDGDAHFREATQ